MTFTPADEAPIREPKRAKRSTRQRSAPASRVSLRKEIDAFIVFLNGIIGVISPVDALDTIELPALVQAIDEEAKANPRFRKGLETLLNVTSGGSLWMVVTVIAARRVARHGAIGSKFGPVVDDGGAFILSTINAEPSEAAETMQGIIDLFKQPNNPEQNGRGKSPTDSTTDRNA